MVIEQSCSLTSAVTSTAAAFTPARSKARSQFGCSPAGRCRMCRDRELACSLWPVCCTAGRPAVGLEAGSKCAAGSSLLCTLLRQGSTSAAPGGATPHSAVGPCPHPQQRPALSSARHVPRLTVHASSTTLKPGLHATQAQDPLMLPGLSAYVVQVPLALLAGAGSVHCGSGRSRRLESRRPGWVAAGAASCELRQLRIQPRACTQTQASPRCSHRSRCAGAPWHTAAFGRQRGVGACMRLAPMQLRQQAWPWTLTALHTPPANA